MTVELIELPSDLIRPGQAAKLLGLHMATVYRMMDDGRLPFYRPAARQRRVRRADVEAMLRPVEREGRPVKPVTIPARVEEAARAKRTMEILRARGLDKYLPRG